MTNLNPTKKTEEKAFSNWRHNGVHLTFPNGNRLSTIWGYCTYSDNYDNDKNGIEAFKTFMDSDTVEIMIIQAPEKLYKKIKRKYDFDGDSIKGYVTMSEWLDIVKMLSK